MEPKSISVKENELSTKSVKKIVHDLDGRIQIHFDDRILDLDRNQYDSLKLKRSDLP